MEEVEVTPETFEAVFKKSFPWGVRAVASKADLDLLMVFGRSWPSPSEGMVRAIFFPDPDKSFSFDIQKIQQDGDQWLVTIPGDVWSFRPPIEAQGKMLTKELNEYDG